MAIFYTRLYAKHHRVKAKDGGFVKNSAAG
jgi:hypothetical protein